ncbi:MAG: DUF1294 domain-containing protein [Prevotella sp.]|jgi:uncharacterized membrane protein YsdA (DUF1294 family)|nr:DUF1294 domain-containing protein [Bacteroidales bacterium]NCC10924.1 DUF1294 domain-containing protein [Bacteroidia bacterium]
MSTIDTIIIGYAIVINVITLLMYGIDKWKAKHSKWRIPEATLLIMAAVGGSIGAWTGIKLFHHKTLHKKFKYGVPAILILQLAIIVFIYLKTNNLI